MTLKAYLTVGWPRPSQPDALDADALDRMCESERYIGRLLEHLSSRPGPIVIWRVDELFRCRRGEFARIKRLIAALNRLVQQEPSLPDVICECDGFTYAFLKLAKNFDFFLEETEQCDALETHSFREQWPEIERKIRDLESYERWGVLRIDRQEADRYLALRKTLAPDSARDERRALATLLVSGPGTEDEISEDLGISFSLADRILPTFQRIEVLKRRNGRYVIRRGALARTLFLLRETIGLDVVTALEK